MRSFWVSFTIAIAGCTGDPLGDVTFIEDDPTNHPIADLDATWNDRFWDADARFGTTFHDAEGLGPVFIRASCTSCHASAGQGPGAVQKMVVVGAHWEPLEDQSLLPYGHTVRPLFTAGATQGIVPPLDASVVVSQRIGPPLFGRGYMEAIDDAEIERIAAMQLGLADGVSGIVNRVPYQSEARPSTPFHDLAPGVVGLIGRFGYKARLATLDDFTAEALQNDMGMTSPMRSSELVNPDMLTDDDLAGVDLDIETIDLLSDYARMIAIPPRVDPPAGGPELFEELGCTSCHVPSMRTRDDYPIAALAGVDAPIYSDLLVHDMGEGLADGMGEFDAGGREWRTAPLIGMRHLRGYLHDGRADTIDEAIRRHRSVESEANTIIERYEALPPDQRQLLLEFVGSL